MQLNTINTLRDATYRVRLETSPSAADTELISDFGEPTISMGDHFYGSLVTFVATPSVGTALTQGSASGTYFYDSLIKSGATLFTVGAVGSYTISTASDISYTLSTNAKSIVTDFPITQVFSDENSARLYESTIEDRLITALATLRANVDEFSGEVVKTI